MGEETNVTHKELLTFSNLTNLEWEFVDLEAIKEGDILETVPDEVVQLNNLLNNPDIFYREYDDGVRVYRYGTSDDGIFLDEQEGLKELRQEAGIAMEYLEHTGEDEEGEFLTEWQVIYGADNYKVVEDYLNEKWSKICDGLNSITDENEISEEDKELPFSREDVEEAEEKEARIRLGIQGMSFVFSCVTAGFGLTKLSSINLEGIIKSFFKSLVQNTYMSEEHTVLEVILYLHIEAGRNFIYFKLDAYDLNNLL